MSGPECPRCFGGLEWESGLKSFRCRLCLRLYGLTEMPQPEPSLEFDRGLAGDGIGADYDEGGGS